MSSLLTQISLENSQIILSIHSAIPQSQSFSSTNDTLFTQTNYNTPGNSQELRVMNIWSWMLMCTMQTHYSFHLIAMNVVILLGGQGKKLLILFHLALNFLSHLFDYTIKYPPTFPCYCSTDVLRLRWSWFELMGRCHATSRISQVVICHELIWHPWLLDLTPLA